MTTKWSNDISSSRLPCFQNLKVITHECECMPPALRSHTKESVAQDLHLQYAAGSFTNAWWKWRFVDSEKFCHFYLLNEFKWPFVLFTNANSSQRREKLCVYLKEMYRNTFMITVSNWSFLFDFTDLRYFKQLLHKKYRRFRLRKNYVGYSDFLRNYDQIKKREEL